MKLIRPTLLLAFLIAGIHSHAQQIDSIGFFTDDRILKVSLTTDIRSLQSQKGENQFQDASILVRFPDSTIISEKVGVAARGNFRRGYCRIPPMSINFRTPGSPRLSSLGKLKLVLGCGQKAEDEELLLKEYICYKLYNLLDEKSFRVRLMKVDYTDTRGKTKPFSQHAFLIEDDGDMARRNACKKKTHGQVLTEQTNRRQMTMVAIFQYMIGNTDWSVPNGHNVKLIFDRKNEALAPFVVPYDFDYCGLVNAGYAIPNEVIGTEKVTERVYRGFPRNMEEIQMVLDIFREKKSQILNLVNSFTLISERTRREMTRYLEEFFKMIENRNEVKNVFIDNARTS